MFLNEFSHTLLKQFQLRFPDIVREMKASDHNDTDNGFFSEWHCEGDVWTHTMMVYSHAVEYVRTSPNTGKWKELLVAALLHDIGKPATREWKEEKQKIVFYGHSGVSTLMAVDVLNELDIVDLDVIFTLELINYHQILFTAGHDAKQKVFDKLFEKFDTVKGAILLEYINILRSLDYAGNIALAQDNVDHKKVWNVIKQLGAGTIDADEYAEMQNKPVMFMPVGIPGCGKSTFFKEKFPHATVVSRDDCVMEHAPGMTYDEAWKAVDQQHVDQLFNQRLREAIIAREDFVLDRTNLTHKGRMKFINQVSKHFYVHIFVIMLPLDVVESRNANREGKVIPKHVIENMMRSLELPFPNEAEAVSYILE